MKVLIVGGASVLTNSILDKLRKEGDQIYILTGSSEKKQSYRHVAAQYDIPYDSACMKEIFESASPDVTVFMGAYDSNFAWENAQQDAVRYQAGLANILIGYALAKQGKFIYLSSECVYCGSYPEAIPEDRPDSTSDIRGMAISQGEQQCRRYQGTESPDMLILRLDHLYAIPEKKSEAVDLCSRMCIRGLSRGVIEANSRHSFSALYISDAVMCLYAVIHAPSHRQPLYHVSSGQVIDEKTVAELIRQASGEKIEIKDDTSGTEKRIVLDGSKFREEFHVSFICDAEKIVPQLVKHIQKNRSRFLAEENEDSSFWEHTWQKAKRNLLAVAPFLENVLAFAGMVILSRENADFASFFGLDMFLLYVILFAIFYGQKQAVISALLAAFWGAINSNVGADIFSNTTQWVLWVVRLFVVGLSVGYLKDRNVSLRANAKENEDYLNTQLENIKVINDTNARIKNVVEDQLVNHDHSLGKIAQITAELERYEPVEVAFYAADVVARLLGTKDVAIYLVSNAQYARLISATSAKWMELGNSICYAEMESMYRQITEKKVFVNRALEERQPFLASGIYKGDQLRWIVMVWGLPWGRLNLGTVDTLAVTGHIVQNALQRAFEFQRATETEHRVPGTTILRRDAFLSIVKAYTVAQQKGLAFCTMLSVNLPADSDRETAMAISTQLAGQIRQTDYIGKINDSEVWVLLPSTDRSGAQHVIDRIGKLGFRAVCREGMELL